MKTLPKIRGIKRNIEEERRSIRKDGNYLEDVKNSLMNSHNLWIAEEDLGELMERVDGIYSEMKGSLKKLEEILRKIDTAEVSIER